MTTSPNDLPELPELPEQRPLKPGLYLVGTPIGNLQDITLRALHVLKSADVILCEDTRVTGKLLSYYGISSSLQVYNDFSEHHNHGPILDRIRAGKIVALVSDAGMPMMSDPGYQVVRACVAADVMVTSIPGPSAILTGLQLSALPTDAFLFLGFLPNKSGERKKRLQDVLNVQATIVLFERAQRVPDVLADIRAVCGDRQVAVARELTKLFEDVRRGTVDAVLQSIADHPIKGEVVLMIDRSDKNAVLDDDALVQMLQQYLEHESMRDAVDRVAADTNMPRRRVYDLALTLKDRDE